MRVLIQLRTTPQVRAAMAAGEAIAPAATEAAALIPTGLVLDAGFEPVELPAPQFEEGDARHLAMSSPLDFSFEGEGVTQLVRGTIPDDDTQGDVISEAISNPAVVGFFSDPPIQNNLTCIGDPPVGNATKVAQLLDVAALTNAGMTGQGVHLAIVDTGMNVAYLRSKGQPAKLGAGKHWTPAGVPTRPGRHAVDHGTMCAYDAGICAPKATYLDHAVLLSQRSGPTVMAGLLSDAVRSYAKLRRVLDGLPANRKALVVSNSWGMFDPGWDFPVGHPGNYSDNPRHPFNVIVASLESAGADILFAAGNCGRECEDGRCNFRRRPICGANSHGRVLSVAGIDTRRKRVGFSSQGPGRLTARKPDLAIYTHFRGSGVYAPDPDSGTSAACPTLAGLVAAVRTKYSANRLKPRQLRALLFKTADDLGGVGFDYDHGWGAPNTAALLAALRNVPRRPPSA